jgi:hypothetical protein
MSLYGRLEGNTAQDNKILSTTIKDSVDKYRSGATGNPGQTPAYDGTSTVAGSQGYADAARRTIFIDDVEATLPENRERGLTAPGWWEYFTYTDASGKTRHKAQHLVAFKDAPRNLIDADDNVAADVASAITISVQPATQTVVAGSGATFSVTAAASTGSLVYQWQRRTSNTGKWANVSGANSSSLALTALTTASTGYEYRVKLTSSAGSEEVISNAATLTVTAA